jgi:Tfp pilus assembly protein PilF
MLEQAVTAGREAIRLKPDDSQAHFDLGRVLGIQGRLDEAIAEFRQAIRLNPDDALAHANLSTALSRYGEPDEAITASREAVRLKSDSVDAHIVLANALGAQGKQEEAIAEYRMAIRLQPDRFMAHYNLGTALAAQWKTEESIAEYCMAIRLQPDYAEAHCNLGGALCRIGDLTGSLAEYRKGHELGSRRPDWSYPSAQWVQDSERLAALADRLPALLKGGEEPKDNADRLTLAQYCYDTRRHAAAARFWAAALAADPKLGDDRLAQRRYNAARAAALAAAGKGTDDPPPDAAAKAKLRAQALSWLKAECDAWTKLLDDDSKARPEVVVALRSWKPEPDLAALRELEALAKLPEAERKDWEALWARVDALIKRATEKAP